MSVPEKCERVGDWLEIAPWRTRAVSLLLVCGYQKPRQADTISGKRDLIDQPGTTMFVLWTGAYHTEARVILDADRERVRDALE